MVESKGESRLSAKLRACLIKNCEKSGKYLVDSEKVLTFALFKGTKQGDLV